MKLFYLFILFLFSMPLFGQDDIFNLEFPDNNNEHEFITFPDLNSNAIYAISFNRKDTDIGGHIFWKMNTKTNETKSKVILRQFLNSMIEVKDIFYHSNHIFCLKKTSQSLILQPLSLEEETIFKPKFISLSKFKEQYIASKFINNCLYVFTGSKKKRFIKIYKIDLKKDEIEEMEIPITHQEIYTLKINNLSIKPNNPIRIIDYKDFNHPNQLLTKNKIYFEEGKIIFLFQVVSDRPRNILYKIDFDAKEFDKNTYSFPGVNPEFNSIYHNNYIYRFGRMINSVVVEAVGLINTNKTVRYITNEKAETIPFQKSLTKKISFSFNKEPLVGNYNSNKNLKMPFLKFNHRTIGLLEYEADSIVIYVGYTPLDVQQTSYSPNFGTTYKYFDPSDLDYYLMETNLPLKEKSAITSFRVPVFSKVIAGCKSVKLETKRFSPYSHKHKLKNEVAGVQIHRLDDGFYGSFFDSITNRFCLKKLVHID